jgi:hypothetical protein
MCGNHFVLRFAARPTSQGYEGQASEITPYHGVYMQIGVSILGLTSDLHLAFCTQNKTFILP